MDQVAASKFDRHSSGRPIRPSARQLTLPNLGALHLDRWPWLPLVLLPLWMLTGLRWGGCAVAAGVAAGGCCPKVPVVQDDAVSYEACICFHITSDGWLAGGRTHLEGPRAVS